MAHTKKLTVSIIPLLLMVILLSSKVHAYTLTQDFIKGYYWQSFPIQMNKFVTNPSDGAPLEELTNQAVEDWEGASGKNLWNFTAVQTSSANSGNYIRWSDNFGAETGYDPTKTLAITIRYNQGTYFQQTVIILNGSLSYLRQNWGNSLKTTILHEIGHTLGLDHSTANAIMAASLSSLSTLQPDDIQGVNAVVDETLRRQATGYVSPYSTTTSEKSGLLPACGTVEDIGNGKGPKNGPGNFIGSLLIGFLGIALANTRKKQMVLVGN
ncbi:MAG: matrixin family metalloprotease [Bacteriovorax sp.]|nr:matrixin family metalloprotease [Bacteriovorax sp.]